MIQYMYIYGLVLDLIKTANIQKQNLLLILETTMSVMTVYLFL